MNFYLMISSFFLNHDVNKIQVDNPIILNLCLFLGFTSLSLISLKKTTKDNLFSVLQTNQMKGLAIILIIIHHLRVHTIENSSDLSFFYDFGTTGVAIFLILSGFGITNSIESKGTKFFFIKGLLDSIFHIYFLWY